MLSIQLGTSPHHLWIYDYQTLIAGILAIVAAVVTVGGTYWAATAPLREAAKVRSEQEKRILHFTILKLNVFVSSITAEMISYKAMLKPQELKGNLNSKIVLEMSFPSSNHNLADDNLRLLDIGTLDLLHRYERVLSHVNTIYDKMRDHPAQLVPAKDIYKSYDTIIATGRLLSEKLLANDKALPKLYDGIGEVYSPSDLTTP